MWAFCERSAEIRKNSANSKKSEKTGTKYGQFIQTGFLNYGQNAEKPGRDPRETITMFDFDSRVNSIDDLSVGMILPGIVTNITNFGAFVDIGVHQDGLVHISQLADHYVSNPSDVVRLHQHVKVRVTEIDTRRNRISLTMKQQ